ncbi:cell wall hydrolase [Proteinivorax hydrogeniformans]|uniref:Cell wall hydrolase n=1 Tax=Proteinivorax hydrogeniformans TaxID=1826727 RepID=A0AAU8HWL4_9FIRM
MSINLKQIAKKVTTSLVIGTVILTSGSAFAQSYTIQRGDSLFTIAQKFDTSIDALKQANDISGSGDLIYAGDKLTIPTSTHTVKTGDTLYRISKENGVEVADLKEANDLDSALILPGQVLTIPVAGSEDQSVQKQANETTETTQGVRMDITEEERELLAKAVHSESRGEPFEGQVAVAAVIFNRVESSEFPNTIEGVIFEPWAFSPVHDGSFWQTPNDSAYRAVEEALKGNDPSGGAIFFYNPVTATNQWIRSREIINEIGSHVFAV